jgi:hypothetical protein
VKAGRKPIPIAGKEAQTRRGARKPRKLLAVQECVTPRTLRRLLTDHVVSDRIGMPNEEALEKLASILESWRGDYLRHQHIEPLQTEVADEAGKLSRALEGLRNIYASQISDSSGLLRNKIEAIDRALASLGGLYGESVAVEHKGNLTWKFLAEVLPIDFTEAIHSTNPRCRIGIGHKGPLVRFIAALSPYLTGEQPTPGSVATQLKRLKREQVKLRCSPRHLAKPALFGLPT